MVKSKATVESEGSNLTNKFEVAFLPWLGVERNIAVGPVTFSPFEPGSILEPTVREYLSRYFRRYVEVDSTPLGGIVLARHAGVADFRYHTDLERLNLKRAVAALALSGITEAWVVRIAHHNEVPVPAADAFQLIFQRFTVNSNFVGVTAGRTRHTWPLNKVMFTRLWAASGLFGGTDRHLLEALGTLLLNPHKLAPDFVERVWRGMEWFRLAHLDGADQTDEAKLVATATAFESLFGLPMSGKQEEFAKKVQGLVRDREMDRGVRVKRNGKTINLSLAGCWAWDLYEIRSRLVHGDAVPTHAFNTAQGMPHLVVADLVLRECLLQELFQRGCFGADLRDTAEKLDRARTGIPEGAEPFNALERAFDLHLKFRRIHKDLGWSKPKTPQRLP
ncbi:hypothetical protein [Candidatus Methylomirabilis sp.]|uniref:hypothetical protein n=1 Tax=Candidatus Methylomirabilis sp. TaxID=2032687 RepID=UPI002A5E56CB|nr:HEPN domain-containing protein [Candidatus Methylomirabilis sp.]